MAVDASRIKAICFDVDGTLSNTDDLFVQKLVNGLLPLSPILRGLDANRTARRLVMFMDGPGNWAYQIADRLGADGKFAAFGERIINLGSGKSPPSYQLIAGVPEMLAVLADRYPLGIISIRGERATSGFLDHFDLSHYFRLVVTGQTCLHTKPYPDPVIFSAAKFGVSPGECLVVGDSVTDILSGKNAGAQTVGVLCGFDERNQLERAGADLVLENTPDLLNYLC